MNKEQRRNKAAAKAFLAAAMGILFAAGCSRPQTNASEEILSSAEISALHVSEGKLKNEADETIVLRGMSTHGLGWYPRYINSASFASLKEAGANVIRLAMYSDANDGYLEEPYNLDFVYIGIENAIEQGLYVIVDWHILKDGNPLTHMEEAEDFFHEISSHYKDTPNILYEICNEPNGDTTWEDVREYADNVIPVIRENAPGAVILVGSPEYSTAINEAMESPLEYDNIMYSYHKYVDVSQDHEPKFYWLEKAVEMGFPVFVTEMGIADKQESYLQEETAYDDDKPLVLEPARKFLDYLEENQISWCGWALSNSDEIHAAIRKECGKLSGWTEDDLTQGGKLMFSYFRGEENRK